MRAVATIAALIVSPAAALELSDCRYDDRHSGFMTCAATNAAGPAVASFTYGITVREDGRSIPWGEAGSPGLPPRSSGLISGGIEPGETVELFLIAPDIPKRADRSKLILDVEVYEVRGADGQPIP